jgi:TetR/AcrR family transcriptional repressor of nem operon
MRMTPEKKDKARAALVDAAGRLFREQGVAATGVDAIAREVGQTSGAFYAHFPSKAEVLREAVDAGFARLIGGIRRIGETGDAHAAREFAQRYLTAAARDNVGRGCLLPTLANDAARADATTHRAYGEQLAAAAAELAKGCGDGDAEQREDRAFAMLALCAGGMMLARAMPDQAASDRMLNACRDAAAKLVAD